MCLSCIPVIEGPQSAFGYEKHRIFLGVIEDTTSAHTSLIRNSNIVNSTTKKRYRESRIFITFDMISKLRYKLQSYL